MTTTRLTGIDEIREFVGRSWGTIHEWIRTRGFPAKKIHGQWESDQELILE